MNHWFRAVVLAAVLCAGCAAKNTTVTGLPAGVAQSQVNNWTSAVGDLKQAQDLTHSGLTTVIALNKQGTFPDGPAYAATLGGFGRAEQVELAAAMFLKTVPNDWSLSTANKIAAYSSEILAQLQMAASNGSLGIKAAAPLAQVTGIINNAVAVIHLVQQLAAPAAAQIFAVNPLEVCFV